jgi:hypothetical protein
MKKRVILTSLFLPVNIAALFAQGAPPCDTGDPDLNCPIDTWVVLFAALALIITVIHLHRKDKTSTSLSKN